MGSWGEGEWGQQERAWQELGQEVAQLDRGQQGELKEWLNWCLNHALTVSCTLLADVDQGHEEFSSLHHIYHTLCFA